MNRLKGGRLAGLTVLVPNRPQNVLSRQSQGEPAQALLIERANMVVVDDLEKRGRLPATRLLGGDS